jgi:hypothetical protein
MKFKLFTIVALIVISFNVFSHEGHTETSLKSLHGGVVKKTSNTVVEVVQEDGKTEIYVTGHDYKSIAEKSLGITANAEVKGKKIPLTLNLEKDHYVVITDLKNVKHFKLNVLVKSSGKEEKASFALENN